MFDLIVTLIVAVPLIAALCNGLNLLLGESLYGWRSVQRITVGAALLSFVGSLWVFYQIVLDPTPRQVTLYRWIASGDLSVDIGFLIDTLSGIMMLVVTGFAFLIGKFSINYMHNDFSFSRYFSAFALFIFAMLVLVMGNNFVMLFVGWESVGVCSYLLIGHYYDRVSAARAGTKAFVMNRIGDAGFLMGIFMIAANFKTVNYVEVFAALHTIDTPTATAIGLCLLLGAIGKSAQLPLGTWLAKAMEGPTPSSALIHAATMVTAGVYMIVRSHELYNMAPTALLVIALVGALTALYGAFAGQTTSDIKGILAFSTTTQLGLMFLACGLGAYVVAIFHLVAHAFLKSFLFLTAPSILHHLHGKVDPAAIEIPSKPAVPIAYWLILVTAAALVVVPLLGNAIQGGVGGGSYTYVLAGGGIMALFCTIFYAVSLTKRIFGDDGHDEPAALAAETAHQGTLLAPMVLLAVVAGIGLMLGVLPGGLDNSWFQALLKPVMSSSGTIAGGNFALGALLAVLLIGLLLYSWFTALFLERHQSELSSLSLLRLRGLYSLALNRFWLDEIYDRHIVQNCKKLGAWLDRVDSRVIDRIAGSPVAVVKVGSASSSWENRLLTARSGGGSPATAAIPATSWKDDTDIASAGVAGWSTSSASALAGWTEKQVVGRATGAAGWATEIASRVAGWAERDLVGRATGLVGGLTSFVAGLTSAIERHVFGTAVNDGVPQTSRLLGRIMNGVEEVIGRPVVMGVILTIAVLVVLLGVKS